MEGAVGHLSPEVQVLFKMLVGSRSVTDDAEADERHLIEIAYLSDGSRFHVDSQSLGEVTLDFVQFAAVGDELVARADKTSVNGCFRIQ